MVEPKLALFKMQIKSGFGESPELGQAHFCNTPGVFDTVDMRFFIGEFIVAMLHSVMFFITQINQTVITLSPIKPEQIRSFHSSPIFHFIE